jgi:hypothetical protein
MNPTQKACARADEPRKSSRQPQNVQRASLDVMDEQMVFLD